MSQKHVETEYKYELPDDADVPYLGSLPGVASVAEPVNHELEATYFDPSGLELMAAGIYPCDASLYPAAGEIPERP